MVNNWRNRLAWRLSNFVLNHIGTKDYADLIGGAIQIGLHNVTDYEAQNRLTKIRQHMTQWFEGEIENSDLLLAILNEMYEWEYTDGGTS